MVRSHARRSPPQLAPRVASALLLAVFFASGFAALLYQVIWQRILALFSGADVYSVTVIVAAFMAGLGLGNLAGGHLADRLGRGGSLLAFALAEAAVAVFGLASKTIYYDVIYRGNPHLADSPALLAVVLFSILLWPTFFMGVSLPLLARGMTPALSAAASTVGSLYGWNTLGAATGALVTTWFLLRSFDLAVCLRIGAATNLAAGLTALPLALSLRGLVPSAAPGGVADERPASARPRFPVAFWLALYALSGFVALSLEIAWFRSLGVALKSTSFTFGTLLGIFLLGVGGGSVVGARAARKARDPAARFLRLQGWIPILAAASLVALVVLVDRLEVLAGLWVHFGGEEPLPIAAALEAIARDGLGVFRSPAADALLARTFAGVFFLLPVALIGPATYLMGFSFPFLQRAVQTDARYLGRRVGWLQTANIAGSLAGTVLTGFALLPGLGTPATFRGLAAGGCLFALLALYRRLPAERGRLSAAVATAAALIVAAAVPGRDAFWSKLHGLAPGRILVAEDAGGVSAIVPVPSAGSGYLVMAGGLGLSAIPYGSTYGFHPVLGALPILLHPDPQRVAVIGLGSGETIFAVSGAPAIREIVGIEIIPSQAALLRLHEAQHAYLGLHAVLHDPRIRLVVADGRAYLRRDPEKYDVIEADALRPSSAYSGNLYSLEYFSLVRGRLRPGGLAVTWVPTPRVRDTVARVFPHVVFLQVFGTVVAVASDSPVGFDRDQLAARLADPALADHFHRAGIDVRQLILDEVRWLLTLGPADDRSSYGDVNFDLFAKDEFLVGGASGP